MIDILIEGKNAMKQKDSGERAYKPDSVPHPPPKRRTPR
jgi:hypothetical protein